MEDILQIQRVSQANELVGKETLHPLVTVIDFSKEKPMKNIRMNLGLYGVFLKVSKEAEIHYGRSHYDYEEGTLIAVAPGQVIGVGSKEEQGVFQPEGWALMFHPDFLLGTSLSKKISEYTFFSYSIKEALHLSQQEIDIIIDCFRKIENELTRPIDKHSKTIVISTIELFLNYCARFYDRQFITRDRVHQGVLQKFEDSLQAYFQSEIPQSLGLPSVGYFADLFHLSANYFGDLIKKETGKSAQEYIQSKLIELAKEKIHDPNLSLSEIAYGLGFKYPQHFTRLFKQQVGVSPKEFRESIN